MGILPKQCKHAASSRSFKLGKVQHMQAWGAAAKVSGAGGGMQVARWPEDWTHEAFDEAQAVPAAGRQGQTFKLFLRILAGLDLHRHLEASNVIGLENLRGTP